MKIPINIDEKTKCLVIKLHDALFQIKKYNVKLLENKTGKKISSYQHWTQNSCLRFDFY